MSAIPLTDERPTDAGDPVSRLRRMAVALRVSFTWWGVKRALSDEQMERFGRVQGADTTFLSGGKKIINTKDEAFRVLTKIRTSIKQYWYSMSLPYVEAGTRLVRQSDVDEMNIRLRRMRDHLIQAVDNFDRNHYRNLMRQMREKLGELWNEQDYPESVRPLFDVVWDFPNIEPPQYLMQLSPEIYQQEARRISQQFEESVALAEQMFMDKFSELISHLTERLSPDATGGTKRFQATTVTNLQEFFEQFRRLNVSSNPDLDRLVNQAKDLVGGRTAGELKQNVDLRKQISEQMGKVQSELSGMIVNRPRRTILRIHDQE